MLEPNKGKNLIIQVNGRQFARYPVKTKLITPDDKDIATIVQEFIKPYLQPNDIVFISEKAVSITQGRSYPLQEIKPSWLATYLSKFVTKTPIGIGLGSPQTMQLALEEVGVPRILLASLIGAIGKMFGVKGWFYVIAGDGARSIDGAVPYALPPYNTYVSKGPRDADKVAAQISKKLGTPVAIVDANDFGVNILGTTNGVDRKLVTRILKDNPLGQSDEQTPIGIIREVVTQAHSNLVRVATLDDRKAIIDIANLLYLDIPDFVWNKDSYVEHQIKNGEYFLIEHEGHVAGIMSMRERNHKMHIETLVVKTEFQRHGFGTQFIEFAKQFSKERGFGTLHAYSFNEYNMVDFYLKKGFTKLEHTGSYNGHPYYCFEIKLL